MVQHQRGLRPLGVVKNGSSDLAKRRRAEGKRAAGRDNNTVQILIVDIALGTAECREHRDILPRDLLDLLAGILDLRCVVGGLGGDIQFVADGVIVEGDVLGAEAAGVIALCRCQRVAGGIAPAAGKHLEVHADHVLKKHAEFLRDWRSISATS